MQRLDPVPIHLDDLPLVAQAAAGPDAPVDRKMMLARAAIPMPPEDLLTTLAFLATTDRYPDVTRTSRDSVDALPWGVLSTAVPTLRHPGVLDYLARNHGANHDGLWTMIAGNRLTADETVAWIGSKGRGPVLDQIASNQMRYQRFPAIVEALYYNAETRMGTVSTLLENAVRLGVDLSHIPGYQEIVASIFGEEAAKKLLASAAAPEAEAPTPDEPPAAEPGAVVEILADAVDGASGEELQRLLEEAARAAGEPLPPPVEEEHGTGEGLPEEDFFAVLKAVVEGDAAAAGADPEEKQSSALWTKIGKLSIAQKVRVALVGDQAVRALLIRDTRRIVYLSVLKSPRLTDKEIAGFAKSRNVAEEIIRIIASTRDWTKMYPVKMSLVSNPKCPPVTAVGFLKTLNPKDLKHISQSRDVPGYVVRQAKQIMSQRESGKKG